LTRFWDEKFPNLIGVCYDTKPPKQVKRKVNDDLSSRVVLKKKPRLAEPTQLMPMTSFFKPMVRNADNEAGTSFSETVNSTPLVSESNSETSNSLNSSRKSSKSEI
jgi:hypothetical protein